MALVEAAFGKNIDFPAGGGGYGWKCEWGEQSVHQHVVPFVEPGQRVLDLGAGWGRASLPLAFKGARMTLVDHNEDRLAEAREIYEDAGMTDQLEQTIAANIAELDPQRLGTFDVVMATNATTHMLKPDALAFVAKLPCYLKSGQGIVVVDGPSKRNWLYTQMKEDGTEIAHDTCEEFCGCSGEPKMEPIPFFGPGEIELELLNKGGRVLYTRDEETPQGGVNRQVIARFGKK